MSEESEVSEEAAMMLSADDRFALKLTGWRENRGGGAVGMQSAMNAMLNRAAKHGETVYDVCTDRLQVSSMTALDDPQTVAWAKEKNPADWSAWGVAEGLAAQAEAGTLPDLTGGATLYYAIHGLTPAEQSAQPLQLPTGETVPFPKGWDRTKVRFTRLIEGQAFFQEL